MVQMRVDPTTKLRVATAEKRAKFKPPLPSPTVPKSMRKFYRDAALRLWDAGLWTPERAPMLEAYCAEVFVLRELSKAIERDGVVLPGGKVNPALSTRKAHEATVMALAKTLGIAVQPGVRRAEIGKAAYNEELRNPQSVADAKDVTPPEGASSDPWGSRAAS